jgi:hypothetical protein
MGAWLIIALALALLAALSTAAIGDRGASGWLTAAASVGAFAAVLVAVFGYDVRDDVPRHAAGQLDPAGRRASAGAARPRRPGGSTPAGYTGRSTPPSCASPTRCATSRPVPSGSTCSICWPPSSCCC